MGGWWVIITGVMMLFLSLASSSTLSLAERFEREGRSASATVTSKYTTESRDSDGDVTTTYWFSLEYRTQRGEEITKEATVSGSRYRAASEGAQVELLYLETEPERIEIEIGSNRRISRWTQIFSLIIGIAWLSGLWSVGGWAVAAVRARRYGTRVTATIEEVKRTAVRVNGRARYRLVWKDASGRSGHSLLQKEAQIRTFGPGDQIDVYQGVKYSWWVGDVGEREEYTR